MGSGGAGRRQEKPGGARRGQEEQGLPGVILGVTRGSQGTPVSSHRLLGLLGSSWGSQGLQGAARIAWGLQKLAPLKGCKGIVR